MKSLSKEQLYVRVNYSYFFSSSHRICFYAFLGERSWLLWRQSCFDECRWEDTLCWQGSRWVFLSLLFRHIAPKQKGLVLTNPVTLIRQKAHGAQITSSNPRSIPCFSQLTVRHLDWRCHGRFKNRYCSILIGCWFNYCQRKSSNLWKESVLLRSFLDFKGDSL